MATLVTGAAGFIGSQLARQLAESGEVVHALVRNNDNGQLVTDPNIKYFVGDIRDTESLDRAMQGCDKVYHVAAYASNWEKNKALFYSINVQGTKNVMEQAIKHRVSRVVYTSTAGIFGPQLNGNLVNETNQWQEGVYSEYERTKQIAEKEVLGYVSRGLDVVIVNPTRVYGPGKLSTSNVCTRLMKTYHHGGWRFVPGDGKRTANYVFVKDVVKGHMLAMEKGKSGERYLIGGSNLEYRELFDLVMKVDGKKKNHYGLPLNFMLIFAHTCSIYSKLFNRPPLITPVWIRKYMLDWSVDISKAERELGYRPTHVTQGFKETIDWLKASN